MEFRNGTVLKREGKLRHVITTVSTDWVCEACEGDILAGDKVIKKELRSFVLSRMHLACMVDLTNEGFILKNLK